MNYQLLNLSKLMPAYGEGCAPTTGAMFTKDANDKNYGCQVLYKLYMAILDIVRSQTFPATF